MYLQGLTNADVNNVMPLVHPLLTLCQLGDQGEQIQVSNILFYCVRIKSINKRFLIKPIIMLTMTIIILLVIFLYVRPCTIDLTSWSLSQSTKHLHSLSSKLPRILWSDNMSDHTLLLSDKHDTWSDKCLMVSCY